MNISLASFIEENLTHINLYLKPIIIIGLSIILGFIIERFALTRLIRLSRKFHWDGLEMVFLSFRGMIIFTFFLEGLYALSTTFNMQPSERNLLQKLLIALIVLLCTILVSRMLVGFVRFYSQKNQHLSSLLSSSLLINITRGTIIILGLLIMLESIGISVSPILTALGVGGLAIALALRETLSNLFAGLQIIATKQINIGDFIELDSGQRGMITDINWRYTTIKSMAENLIVIPNSKLSSAILTNYNLPSQSLRIIAPIIITPNQDLDQIEKIVYHVIAELAQQMDIIDLDLEPRFRIFQINELGIHCNIIIPVKKFEDQFKVVHQLYKAIHNRFNMENISFAEPFKEQYSNKSISSINLSNKHNSSNVEEDVI